MRNESEIFVIRPDRDFSNVPNHILENATLSLGSRALLGYLVSRPPGWKVFVGQIQRSLGLTEKIWKKHRDELIAAGHFFHSRHIGDDGKFFWRNEVHEIAVTPQKGGDGEEKYTSKIKDKQPEKRRTTRPKSVRATGMDAGSIHARGADRVIRDKKNNSTTTSTPLQSVVGGGGEVEDLGDFATASIWAAKRAGSSIKNEAGLRATIKNRIKACGPSEEDLATLAAWRRRPPPAGTPEPLQPGRWLTSRGAVVTIDESGPVRVVPRGGRETSRPRAAFMDEVWRGEVVITGLAPCLRPSGQVQAGARNPEELAPA